MAQRTVEWKPAGDVTAVAARSAAVVDVWRARLDQPAETRERLRATLSSDERERAARFFFARDGDRFVVGRGILRCVLGGYLERRPDALRFTYDEFNRPELKPGLNDRELRFNVSHSGDRLLIAVAFGHTVGVDIERIRDGVLDLAERVFSPSEVAALRALEPSAQREAFFRCWTCKEAFVKAKGRGLSIPLDQFDVAFGSPLAVVETRDDPLDARRWSLYDVAPGDGFAATVAVNARDLELRRWEYLT